MEKSARIRMGPTQHLVGCHYSPTEGGITCVSTLTSMTASMMVLLCRLDKEPTMALAASWTRRWSGKSSGRKDWEAKRWIQRQSHNLISPFNIIDLITVSKTVFMFQINLETLKVSLFFLHTKSQLQTNCYCKNSWTLDAQKATKLRLLHCNLLYRLYKSNHKSLYWSSTHVFVSSDLPQIQNQLFSLNF